MQITHSNGHCSGLAIQHPSLRKIEQGATDIEKLLRKNILCRHDVESINQIYEAIERLEKTVQRLPKQNSHYVLQKIIEKIQNIACKKLIDPSEFMTWYYLQDFSKLQIKNHFDKLAKKFNQDFETLANLLPDCDSIDHFNQDTLRLFGQNPSQNISKILEKKRERILQRGSVEIVIQSKKAELIQKNHPFYFDELLDGKFLTLYDHLVFMRSLPDRNTRKAEIEKMSISSLCHVILQTRSAIIQKVQKSIPSNSKHILFLLGGSGAGKSTILCFLRKDEMVLKDFCYFSKNDKEGLIGHGGTSCTFLPTIEIVNDWAIVDFPGFEDTNGQLISLGMEFALKALIKRYIPKVLVLESITNTEGIYAAAADLGYRLRRLLKNPEDCILGITKYAKDLHFGAITTIEEEQIQARSKPSVEELSLQASIQALSKLNIKTLDDKIKAKQAELVKLLEEKSQKVSLPLPETEKKTQYKELLREKEEKLSKQIGLKHLILFKNLEGSAHLYFERLSKEKNIHCHSIQTLEPENKQLITLKFKNDLLENLDAQINLPKNLKIFRQNILESSLISTILSYSHSEIGQFLHASEMDLAFVRSFDKEIVQSCIKKYMEAVIHTLDIPLIKRILKDLEKEVPKEKIIDLQENLKKVQDYIMGLLGKTHEDEKDTDKKWVDIRSNHQAAVSNVEEQYQLPTWLTVLMGIPLGIPYGIYSLMKRNAKTKVLESEILKIIQECSRDLDVVYNILYQLKSIENLIKKHDSLDLACALPISTESPIDLYNSLLDRIHKVRIIYGAEDWDARVSSLTHQFILMPFDAKNAKDVCCLLEYACLLIEPQVYWLWKGPHHLPTPLSLVNFPFFEAFIDENLPVVHVLMAAALLKVNGDILTTNPKDFI